jgi:hypothetical protein
MPPPLLKPLIDDARARQVREALFEQDVRMKDLLGKQLTHLESIEENQRGALIDHVPAMIEACKEWMNAHHKNAGLILAQAPVNGEPKYIHRDPGVGEPKEPESLEEVLGEVDSIRLHQPHTPGKRKLKKPKRKASA